MGDVKVLKELGKRIAARRKEKGMTQEGLSEAMEVSVQMISNLEQGKKAIRPENLIKLCHALSVSADELLFGSSPAVASELAERIAALSSEDQILIGQLLDRLSK